MSDTPEKATRYRMRSVVIAAGVLCATGQSAAQNPMVNKAAQELALYVRTGEICGFPNHPGSTKFFAALQAMDKEAVELGIASGSLMVDGMVARHGKKKVCAEASPHRAGMEEMLDKHK